MVYLVSVADGWLADRILGSYRAVLRGGILIACGPYAMAMNIGAFAGQLVTGRLGLAALATLPAVIGRLASASTAPSRWRWAWP
ncbi:hypothetical protein [Streptomyces avidinii]